MQLKYPGISISNSILENEMVESSHTSNDCEVNFIDRPLIDSKVPRV